jgi:hypothetical protein
MAISPRVTTAITTGSGQDQHQGNPERHQRARQAASRLRVCSVDPGSEFQREVAPSHSNPSRADMIRSARLALGTTQGQGVRLTRADGRTWRWWEGGDTSQTAQRLVGLLKIPAVMKPLHRVCYDRR